MNRIGILLINIGSPKSYELPEVRRYLKKFLMDKEVIDIPWLWRWILVHLLIVPRRAVFSAENYRKIWLKEGSPLTVHSFTMLKALQSSLAKKYSVRMAMCNSAPSIKESLDEWRREGVKRILAVPLFPQFARATTGSVMNEIEAQQKQNPDLEIKLFSTFYASSAFMDSTVRVAQDFLANIKSAKGLTADHFLFSFHGLPEKQILKNPGCAIDSICCAIGNADSGCARNCYRAQCFKTAQLLAQKMNLSQPQWSVSFQSRLGKARWIEPATDRVLFELAKKGSRNLAVLCPSFVADCIETLEEIGIAGQEIFVAAGGANLLLVPCLNADRQWVQSFGDLLSTECQVFPD